MNEPTHASWFSGAGGLDLGLERAGWRTVSFSEIDPYASAVLAERWPGVPNLGDIVRLAAGPFGVRRPSRPGAEPLGHEDASGSVQRSTSERDAAGLEREPRDWRDADLWSGGFPCQDLSVAGKRRGLAGSRSGLAFSFLDLVGRHRPRFVLLENVPGLLSSHGGKDFGTLLATLVELGYGVGYRVLDARYFGVPQRRRRVFILGDSLGGRAGAERAAEVLSVGSRCRRHPPTGIEAGEGAAAGARPGVDIARAVTGTSGKRHDDDTDTLVPTLTVGGRASGAGSSYDNTPWTLAPWTLVSSSPDSRGVRAPDGLARRSHDRDGVVNALDQRRGGADDNEAQAGHLIAHTLTAPDARHRVVDGKRQDGSRLDRIPVTVSYRKATKAHSSDDWERWEPDDMTDAITASGLTPRTDMAAVGLGPTFYDTDPLLLPLGLDSHRYRCCGNGVVADVGEWIGQRLLAALEEAA